MSREHVNGYVQVCKSIAKCNGKVEMDNTISGLLLIGDMEVSYNGEKYDCDKVEICFNGIMLYNGDEMTPIVFGTIEDFDIEI